MGKTTTPSGTLITTFEWVTANRGSTYCVTYGADGVVTEVAVKIMGGPLASPHISYRKLYQRGSGKPMAIAVKCAVRAADQKRAKSVTQV